MSPSPIRRVAICTGGWDAPGLNAVIRSVTIAAINRSWECYGIRDAFNGILFAERYPNGGVVRLDRETVRGIAHQGGTILGTPNKGDPFHCPTRLTDGIMGESDRSNEIVAYFADHQIDALVSVGGDGSLNIAKALHQKGLRVVGLPKTIDNDLDKTMITFGFDSAVAFATECLDRLQRGGSPTAFDRLAAVRFVWCCGCKSAGKWPGRRHGGADLSQCKLRSINRRGRPHEGRAAGWRHAANRTRCRHLPGRLTAFPDLD